MKNNNMDVVGKRKIFFTVSLAILAVALLTSFIFGVEMSIEFKGGTIITYEYNGDMDLAAFEKSVEDQLGLDVKATGGTDIATGNSTVQISLNSKEGLTADRQFELTNALEEEYKDYSVGMLSSSDVNPSSGREFFLKCLVAVVFAFVVLILYIALRFKKISGWSAGVMAIVALLHDVMIVFATFVIFRIPIDANFMAVVLTILGYSVNATIVIYDRIRENQKIIGKRVSVKELVNTSINQCWTRSINTTITTVMCMIVVSVVALCMNVQSILSFSFPLIIGLLSGLYSSTCLAGSLWVMWQEHKVKAASYAKK